MKFTASRLSEGNKIFPAEIHIENTGLTVRIPGLFKGKSEYFDYKNITNVSVETPLIGYSTITFHAAGAKVAAHGFTTSEVKQIKQAIENGKSNKPNQGIQRPNRQPIIEQVHQKETPITPPPPSAKESHKNTENQHTESQNTKGQVKSLLVETGQSIMSEFRNNKAERLEKEKLYDSKKQEILNIPRPTELNAAIEVIDNLILRINSEPWINKDIIRNQYTDLCFERLKQLINGLSLLDPSFDKQAYEKQLKKLNWSRFFKKNFN